MNYFYLDASAYAKYYYPEPGSDIVEALIDALPDAQARRLVIAAMSIAETIAVLNRRRNELRIPDAEYGPVVARLLADVSRFTHWRIHDQDILDATILIPTHNLNAADALHLHTALRLQQILSRTRQDQVVMVASDRRLLRAADAEGMTALDPEAATVREVWNLVELV
jgi:predicted nucleic acid-binding protein